jgi:membrane-bound hydrogenase subunit mbhJ
MIIITHIPSDIAVVSPWVYHLNIGSCTVCDREIPPSFQKRYNLEPVGVLLNDDPCQADILLVTGPITEKSIHKVRRVYEQMRTPRAVVAVGSCPSSEELFEKGASLAGAYGSIVPIDVFLPGCPPKQEAIARGVLAAGRILIAGRQRCIRGQGIKPAAGRTAGEKTLDVPHSN